MSYTDDPRVNTNVDFYLTEDPHTLVDPRIINYIQARAGRTLLDLGCGIGGYSFRLQKMGFAVQAIDRNPEYVRLSRAIGVQAQEARGERLPFDDQSFDTVFLVEVLEHIPDEVIPSLLQEAKRIARKNVLFTVPDCTQFSRLMEHRFMHGHFMAVDHVQFFTVKTLSALLEQFFPKVSVEQGDPLYPHRFLPPVVRRPLSLFYRLGFVHADIYSRLYAEAKIRA